MKKYRIIYWFNSMRTDSVVKADNKEDAVKKFLESRFNKDIENIIEVQELQ